MTDKRKYIFKNLLPAIALNVTAFGTAFGQTPRQERIPTALEKGRQFFTAIQREDGAIKDTANPLNETWETVLAATALYEIKGDTNQLPLKKALAWLRSAENEHGLICNNIKCRRGYCIETSAEYLSLLLATGEQEKANNGLALIARLQQPSGQWAIGNPGVTEQKEFPSVTAFALALFSKAGKKPDYEIAAYTWLAKKQSVKGHWGYAWEYYSCPAYALWAVMRTPGITKQWQQAKQRALRYIYSRQQKDGSWYFDDTAMVKKTSRELQTALMLSALRYAEEPGRKAVERGIDFLLKRQQEKGYWNGGYFPVANNRYKKEEYLFATALTMSVLNWYLHNYQSR